MWEGRLSKNYWELSVFEGLCITSLKSIWCNPRLKIAVSDCPIWWCTRVLCNSFEGNVLSARPVTLHSSYLHPICPLRRRRPAGVTCQRFVSVLDAAILRAKTCVALCDVLFHARLLEPLAGIMIMIVCQTAKFDEEAMIEVANYVVYVMKVIVEGMDKTSLIKNTSDLEANTSSLIQSFEVSRRIFPFHHP